jgi:aminobenzoyl-glutamate utilization protein B
MLPLCNTTVWDTHCGAAYAAIYSFRCERPETWLAASGDAPIPQAHTSARAPGANDALVLMYAAGKMTKESMFAHVDGWSINEAILVAGQATADNLPARLAQIQYMIRVPTVAMAETAMRVLDANAEAAARAAHCTWERAWVTKSRPGLANHAMAEATYRNLERAGPPRWGADAVAIARELQRNLGLEPMEQPFLPVIETLIDPREAERLLREQLPPYLVHWTSDDYTDMTWHAPTARLYLGRPMLGVSADAAARGFRTPDWALNALGGIRACIDPMIVSAGRTIGATLIQILTDRSLRDAARAEFIDRTGGGIGGSKWIAPLCDYAPPIHFRWPEYVSTPRGEEWWIPAGPHDRAEA